jgi:hypothetical protein
MQQIHMACDDPLAHFFRTLPLADRRETRHGYDQLAARLPRRGVALCEYVKLMRCHERTLQRLNDAAVASGQVPREVRPHALVERYIAQRAHVYATRRDECAWFLQRAVVQWLYRPDGPMAGRLAREMSSLFGDGGGV